MSGGEAYVLDEFKQFESLCNLGMVDLEPVTENADIQTLRRLIETHSELTGSLNAKKVLDNWNDLLPKFIKVMPIDYKRILQKEKRSSSLLDYRSKTKSTTG